ncbi:MAG: glycosyltransferase [Clostridia bacterium]|nr:glycosyltransferase [Clostridia bacterium]
MVKVSVIVPIYNAEKYLVQCLDSIVNQTLKDIEIILIDDGSTDGSAEICKTYLADSRVSYYHKENAGAVMARRDGISLANGEYIGFVDSDDWVETSMYETMYMEATKNNADIVFCNCIQNADGHRFSPEIESGVYDRKAIEEMILSKTLAYVADNGERRAIRWSNCLRLYRSELIKSDISYNPEVRRCEDLVLTYEATIKANVLVYLGDKYLYHNRVVLNSKSRRYTPDAWKAFKNLILHLYTITEALESEAMLNQMHLRAFFSTIDCLENELKFYKQNKKRALQQIALIMNDEINERYYGNIPIEKMAKRYRVYYKLIHKKRPKAIILYESDRKFTEKVKTVLVKPVLHWLTESKLIGKIYKKIRKAF